MNKKKKKILLEELKRDAIKLAKIKNKVTNTNAF